MKWLIIITVITISGFRFTSLLPPLKSGKYELASLKAVDVIGFKSSDSRFRKLKGRTRSGYLRVLDLTIGLKSSMFVSSEFVGNEEGALKELGDVENDISVAIQTIHATLRGRQKIISQS